MTNPIPERPRTLVGSPPRRQQLEGREAVERAIRFIRCRPRVRPYSAVGHMHPPWLGLAADLNLEELEHLLDGQAVLFDDQRFQLVGDELVVTPIEAGRRLPGQPP